MTLLTRARRALRAVLRGPEIAAPPAATHAEAEPLERPPAHMPVVHEYANRIAAQSVRARQLERVVRAREWAELQAEVWQEGGGRARE